MKSATQLFTELNHNKYNLRSLDLCKHKEISIISFILESNYEVGALRLWLQLPMKWILKHWLGINVDPRKYCSSTRLSFFSHYYFYLYLKTVLKISLVSDGISLFFFQQWVRFKQRSNTAAYIINHRNNGNLSARASHKKKKKKGLTEDSSS